MSRILTVPCDGVSNSFPDAVLADRYNRLARETTGTVRRILLKLAHEAESRHRLLTEEAIDLSVVPNAEALSADVVRTYG